MKYLITYDISNNKRWRRLFRLLKNKGLNVQFSCFEVDMNKNELMCLVEEIENIINCEEDSVFIFPINKELDSMVVKFGKDLDINRSVIL